MNKKQNEGVSTWFIKAVGSIVIAAIAIFVLGEIGLLAKAGINLGFITLEISPDNRGSEPPPPTNSTSVEPQYVAPQANTTCPYKYNGFQLLFPAQWYGPIYGYSIRFFAQTGFQVYYPNGSWNNYDMPMNEVRHNEWVTLRESPFEICIDTYGNVFALYN